MMLSPKDEEQFEKLLLRSLTIGAEDRTNEADCAFETGRANETGTGRANEAGGKAGMGGGRSAAASAREDDFSCEVTAMRDALSTYRVETLAWAERRSAAMPSPAMGRATAAARMGRWALATASLALLFGGGIRYLHGFGESGAMAAVPEPSAQMLKEDNCLLSSVDEALSGTGSTDEQVLGLTQSGATNPKLQAVAED